MRRRTRQLAAALGLAALLVALAHPLAAAATDVWANVAPASPIGAGGLFGRYPLGNYALDQHFSAISASLTGGVDASGLLPMIAYFLAALLWTLTSFLANALITFFGFAFSLDLLGGSEATAGAGALGPVAAAIHSIYTSVFGGPWLVLAISVVGIWAMWRALVQRRYSETAGALALSVIYVVAALFFVAQPAQTIGSASQWTNRMSQAFLSIANSGTPSGAGSARRAGADQLFEMLVFKPWVVLEFGGLEHCVATGAAGSEPTSVPVRPLSPSPSRDAQLAHRLAGGSEVSAGGKVCVNNANKYAAHFLRFGPETDERNAEYEALNQGDASKLPEADPERRSYRLGPADQPASDAMEQGGQYQRLLLAIVVFGGEVGAFCLLGALSVGVILAQVLLLLLLAFAPVALVAAAIPGRGHAFFKGWLEKLCGYLLRKAAYSLILAVLLAVAGAIAAASSAMGWLMSFGLQALFFWAVFLQRHALSERLLGIATGPGAPAREGTLRLAALYGGARMVGRPLRRVSQWGPGATARASGGRRAPIRGRGGPDPQVQSGDQSGVPPGGEVASASGSPPTDTSPRSSDPHHRQPAPGGASMEAGKKARGTAGEAAPGAAPSEDKSKRQAGGKRSEVGPPPQSHGEEQPSGEPTRRPSGAEPRHPAPTPPPGVEERSEQSLAEELRSERERLQGSSSTTGAERQEHQSKGAESSPSQSGGRGRGRKEGGR